MTALIDINDDASARRLTEIAAAWQQLGRAYYAADCLERVLALIARGCRRRTRRSSCSIAAPASGRC